MNILIFNKGFSDGGPDVYIKYLIKNLALKGHEIHVITVQKPPLEIISLNNVHNYYFFQKNGFLGLIKLFFRVLKQISVLTNEKKFDIAIGNTLISNIFALYANLNDPKIKIVRVIHGLMYKEKKLIPSMNKIYKSRIFALFLKLFSKQIEKYEIKKSDLVFAVSNEIISDLNEDFKLNKKIQFLSGGVDTDLFKPSTNKQKIRKELGLPNHPLIIYSGIINEIKNVGSIIKTIKILKNDNIKVSLIICGKPLDNCRKLAQKEGLINEKDVFFREYLEHAVLVKYLQSSTLFCLLSIREGLPLSLLEAMSCEVPPITTSVGEIPNIINKLNGFLIELEDIDNLNLILKQSLKKDLFIIGQNARNTILSNYSWNLIASKFEEELLKLIDRANYET